MFWYYVGKSHWLFQVWLICCTVIFIWLIWSFIKPNKKGGE